jgi:hypothetical protein
MWDASGRVDPGQKGIHSNLWKVPESFPGTLGTGGDRIREEGRESNEGAGGFESIIERCGRRVSRECRRI